MAPRCPETADIRRKAKLSLDVPEPELTAMLEQCCDLRRRGFSQTEIQGKLQLTRQQPSLLLAEAEPDGKCQAHRRTRATPSPNGCFHASTPESRSPPSGGCPP